jgi:hypothetical protein
MPKGHQGKEGDQLPLFAAKHGNEQVSLTDQERAEIEASPAFKIAAKIEGYGAAVRQFFE